MNEAFSPTYDRATYPTVAARRMLASLRVQLLLLLGLGLLLPILIRRGLAVVEIDREPFTFVSAIGIALAILGAQYVIRRVATFPGTSAVAFVVPMYSGAYGIAIGVMFTLRLDYSISLLGISYVFAVVTAFMVTIYADRGDRLFHVVPSARIAQLTAIDNALWLPMAAPVLPRDRNVAIVADLHEDLDPAWERMLADAALEGRPVYHFKQLAESLTGKVAIEHLSENSFGSLLPNLAYRKVKRLVDIGGSLVLLPFAMVPMAAAAVAIRLTSPGPILFRQQRMGYRGRAFSVMKFRTMRLATAAAAGDEEARRVAMTQEDDPRITRLGRFLRKTRIDELPQLFNVLAGEMSLIGPRPEAMALSTWYERELPFYRYRHIVRPGISGWAQVNQGHVAELGDVDVKLKYDFYYIKNFSLWLDMLITVRTIRTMISGIGAR